MASPMTHLFVAVLGTEAARTRRLWFLGLFCSALPDFDGVIFKLSARFFNLRLGGMWWTHRGFSHSLLFALIVGLTAAAFAQRVLRFDKPLWFLALYFSGVAASHGLVDALTHGGEGVMFFAPFHDGRYLFPFTPVPTLKLRHWLGIQGLITFSKELLWIWLPLFLFSSGFWLFRKRADSSVAAPSLH